MPKLPGIDRVAYTVPGPNGTRLRRKSENWRYRFIVRGETYSKAGFKSQAKAVAARDARKAEVSGGQVEDWRLATLDGARLMRMAQTVDWSENTRLHVVGCWKRLFRFFRPTDFLHEIRSMRIRQYVGFAEEQGNSRNTTNNDLVQLKAAMLLAHDERLLPYVPKFPRAKKQPRQQTIATVQLEQVLAAMAPHWRLYYEAAAATGWRASSEIRTRKWVHVDWGPEVWTCCHMRVSADTCACGAGRPGWLELDAASSKTKRARSFPMTVKLRSILLRARMRADAVQLKAGKIVAHVFVRDDGRPLPEPADAWRAAMKALGVADLKPGGKPWSGAMVPHDLRRSWIRQQRSAGMASEDRRALVGHVTTEVHEGYLSAAPDREALRQAALEMDRQQAEAMPDNVVQLSLWRSR